MASTTTSDQNTLAAMIPVRIDMDLTEEGEATPPVEPGTYVAAIISEDGDAYYWHPKTGEPWVSYAGTFSTETGGGFL